jgi:hypothetical protein
VSFLSSKPSVDGPARAAALKEKLCAAGRAGFCPREVKKAPEKVAALAGGTTSDAGSEGEEDPVPSADPGDGGAPVWDWQTLDTDEFTVQMCGRAFYFPPKEGRLRTRPARWSIHRGLASCSILAADVQLTDGGAPPLMNDIARRITFTGGVESEVAFELPIPGPGGGKAVGVELVGVAKSGRRSGQRRLRVGLREYTLTFSPVAGAWVAEDFRRFMDSFQLKPQRSTQ